MEFGMPTLIEICSLEETMKLARALSLSLVELNMNLPQYQVPKLEQRLPELIALKEKYGIFYTIHLDENLNVCDFNDAVRQAYLSTVLRTIELAKHLDAPVLNMHMNHGVHFTLPDRKVRLFEAYREHYLQAIVAFKDLCEKAVGDSQIKICIENTDGYFPFEKEAITLLLKSPVFGLTWDIGHSHSAQNIDEPFLMENQEKLTHFHIHDSFNQSDHKTLGAGEVDIIQRLKIAQKHNCRCVVETKTIDSLKTSVAWLNTNGYMNKGGNL